MDRPRNSTIVAALGAVACAGGAAVWSYSLWRPWCLTWGATEEEVRGTLSGDALLAEADVVTTRAIGISAPPSSVWPWLVQMGPGRAGAYTYDWIENLFGLDMHSADVIVPEFQHLALGDAWRLGATGPVLRVTELVEESSLVLRSDDGNWVWSFSLAPRPTGTRLVSRNRIRQPGASPAGRALFRYVMEPGSLLMERKMLLGLKTRAEGGTVRNPAPDQSGPTTSTGRHQEAPSSAATAASS
jgi:hypothetical protein